MMFLFRYEMTGIRPEYLRDAMPLKLVQRRIQDILCNGEPLWKIRPRSSGRARILVGHGLEHELERLGLEYPAFMIRSAAQGKLICCKLDLASFSLADTIYLCIFFRDTAKYPPLMKTSKLSNSLKYLTQACLGYANLLSQLYNLYRLLDFALLMLKILSLNPYCRYDIHTGIQDPYEDCVAAMRLYIRMRSQAHPRDYASGSGETQNNYPAWRQRELERMSPEELLALSGSDYYCWCLDF